MKLPVQLVDGFDDCQLNWENVQDLLTTPGATAVPFVQLVNFGTVAVAFGTVAFTWSGAATSANETVTHAIGRTPRVWLQAAGSNFVAANVSAATDSTFTANGFTTTNTNLSTSVNFFWLAIG